jgi:hypothetical protein
MQNVQMYSHFSEPIKNIISFSLKLLNNCFFRNIPDIIKII